MTEGIQLKRENHQTRHSTTHNHMSRPRTRPLRPVLAPEICLPATAALGLEEVAAPDAELAEAAAAPVAMAEL